MAILFGLDRGKVGPASFIGAGLMVLVMVMLAGPENARSEDVAQPGVPVVTRLVHRFLDYETRLIEAEGAKDATALQSLLSEDFELRAGPAPGVPVPRDAWLQKVLTEKAEPFRIEQTAVHDLGKIAVVSFLGRRKTGGNVFVVDIWTNVSDVWKLSVRYAAPAGDLHSDIPGWAKSTDTLDKRY